MFSSLTAKPFSVTLGKANEYLSQESLLGEESSSLDGHVVALQNISLSVDATR